MQNYSDFIYSIPLFLTRYFITGLIGYRGLFVLLAVEASEVSVQKEWHFQLKYYPHYQV